MGGPGREGRLRCGSSSPRGIRGRAEGGPEAGPEGGSEAGPEGGSEAGPEGGSERELDVRIGRPDATLADLADVLGIPASALSVDGRVAPPDTGLYESGLVHGSRVTRAGWRRGTGGPGVVLRVTGGLEAGGAPRCRWAGRWSGGRRGGRTGGGHGVSRLHAALDVAADGQVRVTDLGSANGTDVAGRRISEATLVRPEDLVSLGGEVLLRVLPPDRLGPVQRVSPVREAGPGGTLPFNRAPRGGLPADPPRIAAPLR
ncbi:FHA domain-containing protein [Streptomyces sp. M19]